jgi:adenosine deaminase
MRYPSIHSHLGSSVKASDLYKISKQSGHKHNIGNYFDFVEMMNVGTPELHQEYLNRFDTTQKIQSSSLNSIEESFFNAAITAYTEHKTDLIEIRFNPYLRSMDKMLNVDSILLHACIGLKKAESIFPIKTGIIIETGRSFTPEQTYILFNKAILFKNMGIVGVDISGSDVPNFNISDYKEAFCNAKSNGLYVTAHCGEVNGPDEVWNFIEHIPLDRIGHGFRSYEDKLLIEELQKRQICLEICPISNVKTSIVDSVDKIVDIIKILYDGGVKLTICDDGFLFLNATIEDNYNIVNLSDEIKKDFIDNGFRYSFIK